MAESTEVNMEENEWELSKENVLPLKHGRVVSSLIVGLQPTAEHTAVIRRQKQAFENELKTYEGNDPLEVWIRYINWIEQTFPRGGKESPFQDIIQRCIALFQHDERYKNDPRYLGVWIKMASFTKEPCEICKYLYDNKIGYKLASLYEAWASELERMGNTKKADQIYQCGIENGAEPLELLKQRRSELHARVARRIAGEIVAPPNPVLVVEEPCRSALGALKGRGSRSKAPVDRSATTVQHRTERQQTSNIPQSHQSPFCILNDENVDPEAIPQPTGEWGDIPTNVIHKENEQKAGVWNKAKLKQKNRAVVPLNEISSVVEPPFTIYVEESQPTSKQPERNQKNEPNQIVMYPKDKVYLNGKEYQLEEIRAASWEKRFQREEEKRLREAIKEDLEMIRREKETLLQYMAEMKQLIQQGRQDKAQCDLEMQQLIEAARNQIQQHTASVSVKKQDLNRTLDLGRRRELDPNRMALCPLEVSTVDSTSDLLGLNCLKEKENQVLNATQTTSAYNLNQTESTGSLNKDDIVNTSSIPQTSRESNNSMKNSEPSTPSLDFKIINPSPTLNTKQALSVVLDMFNQPMMTAEQSGLEQTHSEDKESEKDTSISTTRLSNKPLQFKIFDESDEDSKPPKPAAGFVIYEDKENSDPAESLKYQRTDDVSNRQVATTKSSSMANSSVTTASRKTATGLSQKNAQLSEQIPLKQTKDGSYSCKESKMPEAQSLGMSEHQPPHSELIFDDISMIDNPALRQERKMELDGEELTEVNEANFIPSITSTVNFTKALSMASTPFHPVGQEALHPSVSIDSNSASAENPSNTENKETSQGHPDKIANRRSSMFVDWKGLENELSPIIECSDEDAKAMCSTNTTNDYPNSTVPVGRLPHSVSKSSDFATTAMNRKSESQCTNHDKSLACQQQLDSQHHHEIDVTNYEPPDSDEINDMLNMSIAINPNNPFDPNLIEHFLSKLDRPLRELPNCHIFDECMPDIIVGKQLNLGKHKYNVKKCFGKGAFAKIYLVERNQIQRNKQQEVMKVQKPACFWEFYICTELKARLQKLNPDRDVLEGVMSITEGYFFRDGSCMTNAFSSHGTLLDIVNVLQKKHMLLNDGVFLVLVIDLLYVIEMMHKCHIIHGDIKPDNILFTYPLNDDFDHTKGKRPLYLKLIDFGQSIDMKMFPEGTTFTAAVETSGFKCIEMKTNRPWTYQTDLFGLVGTIYVLYHHQYMKVYQAGGQWKTTKSFRRAFIARDLLQKMTFDIFSIPNCNELPDLSQYRRQLERILLEHFTLPDLSISFAQLKNDLKAK